MPLVASRETSNLLCAHFSISQFTCLSSPTTKLRASSLRRYAMCLNNSHFWHPSEKPGISICIKFLVIHNTYCVWTEGYVTWKFATLTGNWHPMWIFEQLWYSSVPMKEWWLQKITPSLTCNVGFSFVLFLPIVLFLHSQLTYFKIQFANFVLSFWNCTITQPSYLKGFKQIYKNIVHKWPERRVISWKTSIYSRNRVPGVEKDCFLPIFQFLLC